MANLDPRFICTSDLESLFRDNATGLPLSGGIVTFYSDVNRTVLKPVYQLTGTPGNYIYAPLQNPCVLSSAGTFQDGLGNNIVAYYYPFTGTPAQNTGVQELYYITVVNSGFAPQFVRQGWPQAAGSGVSPVSDEEVDNFIPNGQFLAHNNIVSLTEPPIETFTFGAQTIDAQAIAQGGWFFAYTNGTNSTFSNSFSQIPASGGWGINSFPKFVFNFNCTSIGTTPLTRDLWITWPDINKFSSGNPPGSTPYTLFFDARSNDMNTYTFTLYQIYYFGTGGSPSTSFFSNPIATVSIGPSTTLASQNIQNITFLVNQGTIGTNGDDFIGFALRGPASGWNVGFTDFVLAQGTETFTSFPVQTNDQMLSRGVAGFMPTPNPNGQDLYLPLVLTPEGMVFDHSLVGEIVAKTTISEFTNSISIIGNELLCDGSQYSVSGFSPLGIPYSRLFNRVFSSVSNISAWGNGVNFVNAYTYLDTPTFIYLMTNKAGSQTAPANGSTSPGFTYTKNVPGMSTLGFFSSANTNGDVFVKANISSGVPLHPYADGTAGAITFTLISSNASTFYQFQLIVPAAASLAAGASTPALYTQFSNTSTEFYLWYQISTETDPAPGGTGIKVQLDSTMLAAEVAAIIANTINSYQFNLIVTVAGSSVVQSSWFTFQANGVTYSPWYNVSSGGTLPVGLTNPLEVNILSTDTASAVAFKTQTVINSQFFAVPDLRGMFLRGYDPNQSFDLTARTSKVYNVNQTGLNTFETDYFEAHIHSASATLSGVNGAATTQPWLSALGTSTASQGNIPGVTVTIGSTGFYETRPVNQNVSWAIRY